MILPATFLMLVALGPRDTPASVESVSVFEQLQSQLSDCAARNIAELRNEALAPPAAAEAVLQSCSSEMNAIEEHAEFASTIAWGTTPEFADERLAFADRMVGKVRNNFLMALEALFLESKEK